MATMSMFIGLTISIQLGAIFLAGASVNGLAIALTKKYQKKPVKVIVTSTLAVFETSICKRLNVHKIDELEFAILQTLQLGALNELAIVNYKMKAETQAQSQKSVLEEINDLKKAVRGAS